MMIKRARFTGKVGSVPVLRKITSYTNSSSSKVGSSSWTDTLSRSLIVCHPSVASDAGQASSIPDGGIYAANTLVVDVNQRIISRAHALLLVCVVNVSIRTRQACKGGWVPILGKIACHTSARSSQIGSSIRADTLLIDSNKSSRATHTSASCGVIPGVGRT